MKLVTSDAHRGLVAAIGATFPGATWQRCRTHYAANLMSTCPKSSWPWVKAMLHSVYDQPDTDAVNAQFDRLLDAVADKLPAAADHLEAARPDVLAFTSFPKEVWRQIWSNNPNERLNSSGSPPRATNTWSGACAKKLVAEPEKPRSRAGLSRTASIARASPHDCKPPVLPALGRRAGRTAC